MNASQLIASLAAGLAIAAGPAHALPAPFDFNGSGFDFEAGSFGRNTIVGPQALTISRTATEQGLGGFFGFIRDYTGLGIELSLQLGPNNQASDFQVRLMDSESDTAVFNFPASAFNTAGFTTVRLDAPSFFLFGPVNLADIRQVWFSGDFSSGDLLDVRLDRIAAVAPQQAPVPEPGPMLLAGAGLLALVGARRTARRR